MIKRKQVTEVGLKKAPCPTCVRNQNVTLLVAIEETEITQDEGTSYQETEQYCVFECAGCNTVFQGRSYFNDLIGGHADWDFYPAPEWRALPKWMSRSFRKRQFRSLYELLKDTYGAANRDANILCAMGIRTCFDVACELIGIEGDLSFAKKIDAAMKDGHISAREKAVLEILVDAGSAAAHRGWKPDRSDLSTLLDALETFVHHAIILPEGLDNLAKKIPQRNLS